MAKLNNNALSLLENRYYLRDKETGELIESTPEEMFRRVAKYIAAAEKTEDLKEFWEDEFFKLMNEQYFMPNSPTLMNAEKNKCLSACSVIGEYPDSLEGIYEYLWYNAKLTKYGCGVGQSLSKIRPKGEIIKSSGGKSAGVVNWMHSIQTVATTTIQGDTARRAANMVGLRFNHPDILDFINAKKGNDSLSAMNISVTITDDEFMKAINRKDLWLEWNGKKYTKVNAGTILDEIINNAWADGEPGIIWIDRINKDNPFGNNEEYKMNITNPCFTGDMKILTENGYKEIKDLVNNSVNIVNINGEIADSKVWCSGEKETIKLILSNREEITCTPDHVFMTTDESECVAKNLKGKKIMPYISNHKFFDDEYIKYGFIQGDGCTGRLTSKRHDGLEVNIGKDDSDILFLFRNNHFTKSDRSIYLQDNYKNKLIELGFDSSPLPERCFPTTYDNWTNLQKASFLQGCYSANGCVVKNYRVSYKTTSIKFANKLKQTLLDDFGIKAYITTNKPKKVKFNNGVYLCRESYDINISRYKDLQKFHHEINFYQLYKKIALRNLLLHKAPYVVNIKENGIKKVYDFSEPKTHWGVIEGYIAHNCGEQPLQAFEFCNLGSINVEKLYISETNSVDWGLFDEIIKKSIRFLDNTIDVNNYVLPQFEKNVLGNRKIGLGVTGFANLLIKLGIRYDSQECLDFIDKLFVFKKQSEEKHNKELALEKGNFPNWHDSIFAKTDTPRRNATISTQAPTGSVSTILGTESYGIEPLFMIGYKRRIVDGEILEVNQLFEELLHKEVNDKNLEKKIISKCIEEGTTELSIVPKKIREIFRCANDISPEWHVRTLAQMQKYYDNAISKTVNLPEKATPNDVRDVYLQAFNLGCKGVTVYRNNSRLNQTIQIGDEDNEKNKELKRGMLIQCSDDLIGRKRKLQTGCGSLHVNAYFDPITGELMEVFFSKGSTGGCFSYMNALSRQISSGLRSGQAFEVVIDQLSSIPPCPSYVRRNALYKDTSRGSSCPNAIGFALLDMQNEIFDDLGIDKRYGKANNIKKNKIKTKQIEEKKNNNKCPDCGAELQTVEGCLSCSSCGYSLCN